MALFVELIPLSLVLYGGPFVPRRDAPTAGDEPPPYGNGLIASERANPAAALGQLSRRYASAATALTAATAATTTAPDRQT